MPLQCPLPNAPTRSRGIERVCCTECAIVDFKKAELVAADHSLVGITVRDNQGALRQACRYIGKIASGAGIVVLATDDVGLALRIDKILARGVTANHRARGASNDNVLAVARKLHI